MASSALELRGTKQMQRKALSIAKKVPNRMEAALVLEAELIMTRSKRDYVPVDLGTLRSSGHVRPPERKGDEISVSMAYGGAAAAYALAIHEHPSEHSPPSWQYLLYGDIRSVRSNVAWSLQPGQRGPKYLERPLNEAIPGMAKRMAETIEKGLVP